MPCTSKYKQTSRVMVVQTPRPLTLVKDSIQVRSRRPSKARHVTGNNYKHSECPPVAAAVFQVDNTGGKM